MKATKLFLVSAVTVILPLTLNSCIGDDGKDAIILGNNVVSDIPDDTHADPNPSLYGGTTATMPNIQYAVVTEDGDAIFRMDMTGIQDPATHEWIKLYGTDERNQNIWVEVDDTPKGIKVYNTIDEADTHSVAIDMTFLVDNSGSMDDEANAIARDIMDWAKSLSSNLDIRFACVGYDGAINGAIDFTSVENLSQWLNEGSGTYRTTGFGGANATALKKNTEAYRTGGNSDKECGMAALRYADETFSFRKGSNRIYVNFTDEGNQPAGKSRFSVESLKTDWDTSRGTIHTVFSNGRENEMEYNYLMSQYTGGTVLNTNSSFSGVSLYDLPVSDAIQNSYIIRLRNIEKYMDQANHNVKITVKTDNVRVERNYTVKFVK